MNGQTFGHINTFDHIIIFGIDFCKKYTFVYKLICHCCFIIHTNISFYLFMFMQSLYEINISTNAFSYKH